MLDRFSAALVELVRRGQVLDVKGRARGRDLHGGQDTVGAGIWIRFPATLQNGFMTDPFRPSTPYPPDIMDHFADDAPIDPATCNVAGGPCWPCRARLEYTCPACKTAGTYTAHAAVGLTTCVGCSEKFCTECLHGTRPCCAYIYGRLPPPPPIRRELPTTATVDGKTTILLDTLIRELSNARRRLGGDAPVWFVMPGTRTGEGLVGVNTTEEGNVYIG